MNLFDVYPLYPIEPVKANGSKLWDKNGTQYLDLYGGHAVISIGHTHPHFVERISQQLNKIAFYSNSVIIGVQEELAERLGRISGYPDYSLFFVNSGAEANENALKLASFHTGKTKILAFTNAFHGRTSLAVAATDNIAIQAPINKGHEVVFAPLNDLNAVEEAFSEHDFAAVIVEGIQGVAGIFMPEEAFLIGLEKLSKQNNTVLILDEVQSGYGRTGKFFAHQWAGIKPDLITIAKGMGNGFPIGGLLINPKFEAKHGLLGTTFGGNHLASVAGLAVLEVIEKENLMANANSLGQFWKAQLEKLDHVEEVRGQGLMLGLKLDRPAAPVRNALVSEHKIFSGSASDKFTIRLLPALNLVAEDAILLNIALQKLL